MAVSAIGWPALAVEDAPAVPSGVLRLRAGSLHCDPSASLHAAPGRAAADGAPLVLQLAGPMRPEWRAALEARGVRLGDHLPDDAAIAWLPAGVDPAAALEALPFVRWVGAFEPSWKIDPALGTRPLVDPLRAAAAARGERLLVVELFPGSSAEVAAQAIASFRIGVVLDRRDDDDAPALLVLADVHPSSPVLAALSRRPDVQWIEEAPEATLRNGSNKWILQTNVPGRAAAWSRGLRGEGMVAGVIDDGLALEHCSFADPEGDPPGPAHRKLVAVHGPVSAEEHGTHVAATLLGDERPISNGYANRGLAFGARLVFTSLETVTALNLRTRLQQAHDSGARIHSNSWGDDGTDAYTAWCRDVDRFSWENPDDLVLFAVTNREGPVNSPENAKNSLAVAATLDAPDQGFHCSGGFGPTADGRRKPELTAPGCDTRSADAFAACGFVEITGTSMACPAVAGAAVLVREYFVDGFHPTGARVAANAFVPSGALVKAVLANAGTDMDGIDGYPSDLEGWGRVLLDDALHFAGDRRRLAVVADVRNGEADGLVTGQGRSYPLAVATSAEPLKVTLVFMDRQASPNAAFTPVNNLNLRVIAPDGTIYRGNVFANGASTTGGSPDALNTVEQVLVPEPMPGPWTVRVIGTAVNTPERQGFAIVATGGW